jgi:hypothetical protein
MGTKSDKGDEMKNEMNQKTADMIGGWLKQHHGDEEGLARWMRDQLHIGGIREMRALIQEAKTRGTK